MTVLQPEIREESATFVSTASGQKRDRRLRSRSLSLWYSTFWVVTKQRLIIRQTGGNGAISQPGPLRSRKTEQLCQSHRSTQCRLAGPRGSWSGTSLPPTLPKIHLRKKQFRWFHTREEYIAGKRDGSTTRALG